ncbi:MAG: OmpA family protein, partial [Marinilabiliales bacterium]|nr:OmpA family protein [Marinilabiliales bacterium]
RYFARDGRPGLGGNDLFISRLENGKWSLPVNLGYPINSRFDEAGLIVEATRPIAWFSSDRNPGRGKDLFSFELPETMRPSAVSYLKGIITDATDGHSVPSTIRLTDLDSGKLLRALQPEENKGNFLLCLPAGRRYGYQLTAEGYLFVSGNLDLPAGSTDLHPVVEEFRLRRIAPGSTTVLNNLFFATDSWRLLESSAVQLDEMAQFMKLNSGVVMEIIGHTDNTGTAGHNLELSAKRAVAVAEALKSRGIEPWRLSTMGKGATVPVATNETEAGKSLNRRTEFRVKEIRKP